jgi:hypothetical protein
VRNAVKKLVGEKPKSFCEKFEQFITGKKRELLPVGDSAWGSVGDLICGN